MILASIVWGQDSGPVPPTTHPAAGTPYRPDPLPHEPILPPAPADIGPFQSPAWQYEEGIAIPPLPPQLPPPSIRLPRVPEPPSRPVTPPARQARHFHLREAAHHLEVAGLKEYADKFRELALKEERNAELERKLEALKALQAEIEQLREQARGDSSPNRKQVVLHVQVMEIKPGKRQEFLDALKCEEGESGYVTVVKRADEMAKLIESLRKDDSVRILSQPVIATLHGQEASIILNGEMSIGKWHGRDASTDLRVRQNTSLQVAPVVLDDKRFRLKVRARVSVAQLDKDAHGKPPHCVREVELGKEVQCGKSLVICPQNSTRTPSTCFAPDQQVELDAALDQVFIIAPSCPEESAPAMENRPVVDQPRRTRPRAPR
jgi:hypothetical protein